MTTSCDPFLDQEIALKGSKLFCSENNDSPILKAPKKTIQTECRQSVGHDLP